MVTTSEQAQWFSDNVKPYEAALRAYLMRRFPLLPDHDDLIQEAYIKVLNSRKSGKITITRALLFTVVRNIAIDMFRRTKGLNHESLYELEALPVLDEDVGTIECLEEQQKREALVDAVRALPPRCREVMKLRHLDGMSYKEIAATLKISPETVKIHIMKGMRDCIAFFEQRGLLTEKSSTEPNDERSKKRAP